MSLGSLLPAALDAQTLPTLVAALDRSLYPSPTPGLTARMAVLWALTGLCILMAVLYLWLHYRSTTERPRRRCLWFIRLVERPSGRFIVINPRPALTWVVVVYGTYELVFLAAFYRVYALGDGQVAYAGLRGFNALPFFLGGWAFLVAVEQERKFMSARTANGLFLGVGLLFALMNTGIGVSTTVATGSLFEQYLELRSALVALQQSLGGRIPTFVDLIALQPAGESFLTAANAARTATIVQGALSPVFLVVVLAVNLGGLALARRMRRQIKDSIDLLAYADPDGAFEKVPLGGSRSRQKTEARSVRRLAQRRHGEGPTAATIQAGRVLALQAAVADLVALTSFIAFVCLCLFAPMILIAYSAASDKLIEGVFGYVESTAMLSQWIYTTAVTVSLVYLLWNALRRRECVADSEMAASARSDIVVTALPVFVSIGGHRRTKARHAEASASAPGQGLVEVGLAGETSSADPVSPDKASLPGGEGKTRPRPPQLNRTPAAPVDVAERGKSSAGGGRSGWFGWRRSSPPRQPSTASSVLVTVETSQVCEEDELGARSDGEAVPAGGAGDSRTGQRGP